MVCRAGLSILKCSVPKMLAFAFRLRRRSKMRGWEKESIHRPAPVQNFSLPKKNGGHRGKISVVDMVFLVNIRVLISTTDLESFSLRPEKFAK